ncbi:MAG: S8 family serine peptidase [Geminicoccaceae bacterium]
MSSAIAMTSVIALSVQTRNAQAEPTAIVDPVLSAEELSWARSEQRYERWLRKRAKRFSRTQEYKDSTGLAQIKVAEGYAQIIGKKGGTGVKVAVAAGGIDASHPDLKIKRRSEASPTPGVVDAESTAVAGVIGARRDGQGIHGVAYKAKLIDLEGGSFLAVLAAAGITSVEERERLIGFPFAAGDLSAHADDPKLEADIIHLRTFTSSPSANPFFRAFDLAVERGKIVVVGTGSSADADVISPVFVANGTDGSRLLVGAVDGNNQLLASSKPCAGNEGLSTNARDACLVAPGENIRSTTLGGGYDHFSGTDIAAAHVSGAAAVVKAAFPGVSADDVTNRLLTTATDLGDPGVDDTFGHGLLNLDQALRPQGDICLPTAAFVDGHKTSLSGSGLGLGSGFAVDERLGGELGRVMALDDQGFPFAVDLGDHVDTVSRSTGLAAFIGSDASQTIGGMTSDGKTRFALSRNELEVDGALTDPHRGAFASSGTSLSDRPESPTAHFATEVASGVEVFVSLNDSSVTDASMDGAIAGHDGLLFAPGSFLTPFDQFTGEHQTGGGATLALGKRTDITLSAFTTSPDSIDERETSMQKVELSHRIGAGIELRLGYGWLDERDGFVGGSSAGAFGETKASSSFITAGVVAPIGDDLRLFGSYTSGRSLLSAGSGGLIGDWSDVSTESFGVGLLADDVAEEGDHLSLMVGQPVRVQEATATLTLPTGRTEDGRVLSERRAVDLAPDAREISLEATYQFALDDDDASLAVGTLARFNPDHDGDAEPDLGIGLRYSLRF